MVGIYKQRTRELPNRRGGSTDEWVRGGRVGPGSVKKNEGKKRSDGESSMCSKSRPDVHANLCPGVEPPSEGTRNLRGDTENGDLEQSNFAMGSALCSGD